MDKHYEIKEINALHSGPGWQSHTNMTTEWAVVIEPYGISIKTAKTKEEAQKCY